MQQRILFEFGRINRIPEDWFLAAGLFGSFALFVWWVYRHDGQQQPRWANVVLPAFRIAVWFLLLWVFLDPRTREETVATRPSKVTVAVDTSLSMSIADDPTLSRDGPTRMERVNEVIESSRLLGLLRMRHDLSLYQVNRDARLVNAFPRTGTPANDGATRITPFQSLGDQSRIGDAVADLLRTEADPTLAALILFSDGRLTAGGPIDQIIAVARQRAVPVHVVPIGQDRAPINIRVADVQLPMRAFTGDAMKISATIQSVGMTGRSVSVELLLKAREGDEATDLIEKQDVVFGPDETLKTVEFLYTPTKPGSWQFTVKAPVDRLELRSDDNAASAGFDVIDRKLNVLLWAGGPTREYQFLRNLLYRDPSFALTVLLESARDDASQEAGTIRRVFPETRDELFPFDAIVAIDPDWSVLPAERQELIAEWVARQAGGLVVVAGPVYTPRLARMGDELSKIRELWPVIPRDVLVSELEADATTEPWPVHISSEGESTDYLRLEEDSATSNQRWKEFSGFFSAYPIAGKKPAASVLATSGNPRSAFPGGTPLFAHQYYGSGRSFYLGSGEIWRLRRLGEQYYDRFWVQLLRAMSQGRLLRGSSRGTFLLEGDRFSFGSPVNVRVRLLADDFTPLISIASLPISIIAPTGLPSEIVLNRDVSRPGEFTGRLLPTSAGEYRLQLLVPNSDQWLERRFQVTMSDLEFENPRPDHANLVRIASETGGKRWNADDLTALPESIPDRSLTTVVTGTPVPQWDRGWLMITIVLLLSCEWLIRKLLTLA